MEVRIEPSWGELLREEFDKPYFGVLVSRVRDEYRRGAVYPCGGKIFAAFDATPVDEVKVVIVGQDPYHGDGQANGLAFSVNEGIEIPPSLQNIFKEIQAETGAPIPSNGDLGRWARQGVLLLNSTLTVRAHSPRSHAELGWECFTDAVIKRLNDCCEGLVFMLWGADARRKGAGIDVHRHLVLASAHPSPLSAYRGFFGNGHFKAANDWLASHGRAPVAW